MKKTLLLMLGLVLLVSAAASSAWADSESWYFTGTNAPSQVPCSTSAPCGEITITTSGNTATITVSSLLTGYIFDTFGFNVTSNVVSFGQPWGGEINNPSFSFHTQQDGWGNFGVVFNTGMNGGSNGGDCVVTGGVPGAGCTFHFTVTCTSNCKLSDFITNANGQLFAGHLAAGRGNTGYVGDAQPFSVDEPASLSVVGSGLLLLGGLLRRRWFTAFR